MDNVIDLGKVKMMDSVDKSIDVDVEAIWPYRDYKALIDTWGDLACDQDQSVEPCKFIRDIRGIQIPSYKHRKIKKIRGIGKRRSIIYRKGRYKEFMFTNCYPLSMPTKNTDGTTSVEFRVGVTS